MRNRKLYQSVERLVKERQGKKTCKRTFVEEFCQQQLQKKRLVPKDNKTKINNIMSKFKSIHTYIDVDHLIDCINQIHNEEIRARHSDAPQMGKFKHKIQKLEKHKRYMSQTDEQCKRALERSHQILKKRYQAQTQAEDIKINELIKLFENSSTYFGDKIKHNTSDFLSRLQKRNKFEGTQREQREARKENWNYYENAAEQFQYIQRIEEENSQSAGWQKNAAGGNNDLCKKRKKMFKLARTYLQLILEDQHRRKWNPKQQQTVDTIFTKNQRNNYLKKFQPIDSRIQDRQKYLNSPLKEKNNGTQTLTPITKSSNFLQVQDVKPLKKKKKDVFSQSFQREAAIKKMSNFLEDLEEDQRILNRQKRFDIKELEKFEIKLKETAETTHQIHWDDSERVTELQSALSRQDSRCIIRGRKKK